ncbi:hypothetical protein AN964_00815 [Heyndrickxia shackletonii]|uniref:Uncharacterized protein n=1 Tax=Heyndrickxia shackletonii TaxID=157838 RepID=A0A0Q3TDU3_9BACI|nr:hypothetical protein [Heyndrickxia shackletonii]KQL52222.1 hypothetical protein AN964_00815 [Heyndrickxia shackletonii]MBB2480843.1 hypothetical protein [Bacillus sp. APMAM]NEZ00240.1 hypothetical protein [Heyndrickxia shackletonii]RTZ55826.1 hypothetical protein EKO25_10870 [Bacillus sp. SAJ1]
MSKQKHEKVIHVDKLVIHAKEVEIIQERPAHTEPERRNPWDFFWRGQPRTQENMAPTTAENMPVEESE